MRLLKNRYFRIFLAAALSCLVSPVFSEALSYTSASIGYINYSSKIDGISDSVDGEGYTVGLSYALRPHIAITAEYSASKADANSAGTKVDADIDTTLLGFLIHAAINDTSDFIVGAGFINGKADVSENGSPNGSIDADGGMTIIGFRTMAYENIEINGFIKKLTIEESSSISISFGAGYYVKESVSLEVGYLVDSDDGSDLLMLGVTKYF